MNLLKGDNVSLNRHANNFDFLRLLGAFLVIVAHCRYLLLGKLPEIDYFKMAFGKDPGRFGVVLFFVISGFLVTKSWVNRKSLFSFILSRILRIYPAAIVVILLSVFLLGPLLTQFSLTDYFADDLVVKYLKNIKLYQVDFYALPGLFTENPSSAVNGSLWTIPHELASYVAVILLGLLALFKHRNVAVIFACILLVLWVAIPEKIDAFVLPYWNLDFNHFYGLFLHFYMGAVLFLWSDKIRFNAFLGLAALLLLIVFNQLPFPNYFAVLLIPYALLCIAFTPLLPFRKIGSYGDFSYGLYIYAYPVQQVLLYFFIDHLNTFTFILSTTFFTLVFAYFSWHCIEKPSLKLRTKISI